MEHTVSSRGFKHLEPIATKRAETVRVYESSAAMAPHIWLKVSNWEAGLLDEDEISAHAHLTLDQAIELRDQLDWLIANHYQVAS